MLYTMDNQFKEYGKTPVWMLELKIMAIGVAMLSAISFSILPEILSRPEAFEVSMACYIDTCIILYEISYQGR